MCCDSPIPDYKGYCRKPISFDPHFKGPLKNRSCTDIICLLIFLVFLVCWFAVGIFAFSNGNPDTLLTPKDSSGARCGFDSHVKDKPNLLFFDLTKCLGPYTIFTGCDTPQVCVETCPTSSFIYENKNFEKIRDFCVYGSQPKSNSEAETMIKEGKCPKWLLTSSPVLNRCLYNVQDRKRLNWDVSRVKGDEVAVVQRELKEATRWISLVVHYVIGFFTDSDKAHQVGHDIVEDLKNAWKEMLGGIVLGLLACIIYIVMMRWIAGVMVWISIIGSIALLIFCVSYTGIKYTYYKEHPYEYQTVNNLSNLVKRQETWLTLLIICVIVLAILLLILLFLRKRIVLAIALIKEGSKAVSAATSTLFFPVVPWLLQIGVIIYFICTALYLSTIGSPLYRIKNFGRNCACDGDASVYKDNEICDPDIFKNNCHKINFFSEECDKATCGFSELNHPIYVSYFHAVNVFGFFWGVFFVSALGQMVLAATFATWYWTMPKSKVPFFTLSVALLRTIRYHLGTLAFGSLIIAICRMIRVCLEYIDHKLKKYDNEITKAILCCLKCFFWCLEKFLKFINKNAYIMCAIHGKNFCASAKDAFSLLLRNILRAFVLDKVTDFLFFLSKILVTIGVGCITYVLVEYASNNKFTYSFVPAIFVALCIYLVTCVFFNVYTMAVDTLFLCYLEDCERNDGSAQKPYYMSSSLMKVFGKKNKRS